MKAFTDTTMSKTELLKELRAHQEADRFRQGFYNRGIGSNFKGCAVGCSLESLARKKKVEVNFKDHSEYEKHFGIPHWLARVEDRIFEGLPPAEAKKWPVQFTSAINPGADLNSLLRPYLVIICESVLPHFDHIKYAAIKIGVDLVISLLKNNGTREQLRDARISLNKELWNAADADAADADAVASYAAAAVAAYAAAAAYAADAVADAARFTTYKFIAKELIKLLKGCRKRKDLK